MAQQTFASTQAYSLFLQGKTPVQVAIALNIREPEAIQYCKEYWKLTQLHSLNWVYEQVKDDIRYFVRLYISAKVARMGVEQVVKVLETANNDLPLVEHKCERLKGEADDIEAEKHNSVRILQDLSDQISYLRKICKEQRLELTKIQLRKVRIQGLVDNFQNSNEEYIKIRNTVEEKVHSVLSDKKMLLKLALLSLVESMRNNPDKYSSLIYHNNTSSNADYDGKCYTALYMYERQQYPAQAYMDRLTEEAERLYNKLTKELVDEIITVYSSNISSSLPILPQFDEQKSSKTNNWS